MHVLLLFIAYIQKTGRDGNNDDFGKQNTSQEMKTFWLLTSCRRKFVCEYFDTEFVTCSSHTIAAISMDYINVIHSIITSILQNETERTENIEL